MPDDIFDSKAIKKAKFLGITSILLFFISFGFLFLAIIMQESSIRTVVISVALIGFIGCNILAVFLIYKAYPVLIYVDCRRMHEKYDKQDLAKLPMPGQETLETLLVRQKFKYSQDGYYRKKKLSLIKDSINYVIRITQGTEIEPAFHREISRLEQSQKKWNNLCFIIFVFMDTINKDTMTTIKDFGKNRIITKTVIYPKSSTSVIITAIDRQTGFCYFMDTTGHNISLYSYGCRLLKKLSGSLPAVSHTQTTFPV